VVGLLLSGCSLTSTKTVAPASQRSLESLLLTLRDLPSGWLLSTTPRAGIDLCAAPAPPSSLVGHNGVAVAFQHNGGEPLLIEYLLRTSKPINAMARAMEQVASQASCSESANGRITRKSVNVGIIETPTFGDWSVATKDQIFKNGRHSELGYILVRVKGLFLVVAYQNVGRLDLSRLENLSTMALSKVKS